jgi:hypothetical protein
MLILSDNRMKIYIMHDDAFNNKSYEYAERFARMAPSLGYQEIVKIMETQKQ